VTIEALVANGLGTRKNVPIKILAKGEISKPLTVHAHKFSGAAKAAIEAAGGTCVVAD
jgi:large subunit ribosomal protein L15